MTKFSESAQRQKVKDILSIEIRKLETEISKRMTLEENSAAPKVKVTTATTKAPYDVQIKQFSWDQSDKFVKIYLTGLTGVNELPAENVVKTFCGNDNSVEIRVNGLNGKNHVFSVKETCESFDAEKSHLKVKSDTVSVFLAKSAAGQKWSHLKAVDKAVSDKKAAAVKPDLGKDADPSASLMTMMKQMYDDGDDDMKRTIAKAWTESRNKTGGGEAMMPGGLE